MDELTEDILAEQYELRIKNFTCFCNGELESTSALGLICLHCGTEYNREEL